MVQGEYFFRRCSAPAKVVQRSSLITAPPGDSLRLISGGLTARVSLHSRRHESARPLRNTATAYFVPTLRARREAPSLAPGFGVGKRHFSQRAPCPLVNTPGLCQNNDNARRLPTGPAVNMPPWLRHTQRVVSVCGPDIIANTGLSGTSAKSTAAAHQFCLTSPTSPTGPTNAPHRTLRQNQTVFQYWGYQSYLWLRVITVRSDCFQVLGQKKEPLRRVRIVERF